MDLESEINFKHNNKLMGEVVLVNKEKNNALYHHCTQLGNFARLNYVTK